jgi:hypothetical protein
MGAKGAGAVVVPHAKNQMLERGITMLDVEQILSRGTIHEEAEEKDGCWRYRVHFENLCAAVEFEGEMALTIVTVFRRQN